LNVPAVAAEAVAVPAAAVPLLAGVRRAGTLVMEALTRVRTQGVAAAAAAVALQMTVVMAAPGLYY